MGAGASQGLATPAPLSSVAFPMDTVRSYLAMLLVVLVPPIMVFWCVIHPLAAVWRRVGPWVAYFALLGIVCVLGWGFSLLREVLVGRDLGTHRLPLVWGLLLFLISISHEIQIRKYLTLNMLVWWPQLASNRMESKLLQEGICGRMCYPRYASAMVGMIGSAVLTNHSGVYVVVALILSGLYLITVLEERELLVRFGDEYRHYREEVPRLTPRLTSQSDRGVPSAGLRG